MMERLVQTNDRGYILMPTDDTALRQYALKVSKKLAEYEDLEEQGLLLRLPCKVGDILYIVGSKCLADVVEESECDALCCDDCKYDKEFIVFERLATEHLIYNICNKKNETFILGKTVFLTKEEAEQKLKEIENGK